MAFRYRANPPLCHRSSSFSSLLHFPRDFFVVGEAHAADPEVVIDPSKGPFAINTTLLHVGLHVVGLGRKRSSLDDREDGQEGFLW